MAHHTTQSNGDARRHIRRQRRRRFWRRVDVLVTVGLAGFLLLMVNYLSYQYHVRKDVSRTRYYSLSNQTRQLVGAMEESADLYSLLAKDHPAYEDVERILREYESLGGLLHIHNVDVQRDVAVAEELTSRFDLDSGNVLLLAVGDRRKQIQGVDFYVEKDSGVNETTHIKSFRGEQLISSALQELLLGQSARVYFTSGHGEHALDSFEGHHGYSGIAKVLKQENISAEPLVFGEMDRIPEDADAVVVSGPAKRFSPAETERLQEYLAGGGSVMMMLDALQESGLDPLLRAWGVELRDDLVVDATRTLTGKELFITAYAPHPITEQLSGLTSVFYLPRSVRPLRAAKLASADKPLFSPLAMCSENGWAETDLEENPKRFDPLRDSPGPVPVAAAIERGPVPGIDVDLTPSRLVIFGDSDFVSNAGLNGGDVDFFMNGLDWLLQRDSLISIRPREIETVKLVLDRQATRQLMLIVAGGLPAAVALMGLLVWAARRLR